MIMATFIRLFSIVLYCRVTSVRRKRLQLLCGVGFQQIPLTTGNTTIGKACCAQDHDVLIKAETRRALRAAK